MVHHGLTSNRKVSFVNKNKFLGKQRARRKSRVRKKVQGTADCPRLNVFRSHKHLACQLIDDASGKTLVTASTYEQALRKDIAYGGNCDAAQAIGKLLGENLGFKMSKLKAFESGGSKSTLECEHDISALALPPSGPLVSFIQVTKS